MFAKICNISIYICNIFVIILKDLCVILNVNQGGGFDRRLSAYRLCALKATRTEEPYSSYIKSAIFIFTNPSFFNFPHSPSYYWVDILCSRKLEVCSKAWGFTENSMSVYVIFCWWEMTSSKPVQIIFKKRFYLAPPTPPNNPSFIIWYFFNLKRTSLQLHFLSIFKKGDVQSFHIV